MDLVHDRVAGLDVHRDSVTACVRYVDAQGGVVREKGRFSTTTTGLGFLSSWLSARQVQLVAMESSGVYWKPPYYALEDSFCVWLCNARHVKKVPGRKTDLSDSEWLADVAAHGMVRPSLVPPVPIRQLRELTRYRRTQIDARAAEIQRLDKLLQDAGIKLTSVASRVLTLSGRAMIEALIAGERDPAVLADLAKAKMRAKIPALHEALKGHFAAHHAIAARRILDHLDFLDTTIANLSAHIDARTAAFAAIYDHLDPVPGLDRLSIDVIIAETGGDMSRFPTAGDLASWAGLCPGNFESAGKHRKVPTTPGNRWLRRALIESARAAIHTKDSYFGAQYRHIARHRGPNKAAVAVAHSLIELVWHLLSTGETFTDPGADYYQRRSDPNHQARRLLTQLERLGYTVTITQTPTPN
jgi:transposase